MKFIIIGNGDIKDYSLLKKYLSLDDISIICCDGGLRHIFNLNIIPNYVIGDFDSAPTKIINYYKEKNILFLEFPPKKDKTDMEIALDFAIEKQAEKIFIFGGIGTRFDHTLANAHILVLALKKGITANLINENNVISVIDKEINIKGKKGDLISLIPLTTQVEGLTTNNLEYELNDYTLKIGSSIGVSNVFKEDDIYIKINKGLLFVIQSID